MNSVLWTARALADLQQIRAYIAKFNPQAAASVAATLRNAGDTLARLPQRGRLLTGAPAATRELVTDYRYIIRYRVVGEEVVIMRVRHGARRPSRP